MARSERSGPGAPPAKVRDAWDKFDILLKPVGGILTAVAVTYLTFITSSELEKNRVSETKRQLYAQLMSKREEADSGLRSEMFKYTIEQFLKKGLIGQEEIAQQVLNIEILSANFHETLDLSPLFKDIERNIREVMAVDDDRMNQNLRRLHRTASDVKHKQLSTLEKSGEKADGTISPEELRDSQSGVTAIEREFGSWFIKLEVLEASDRTGEIRVRLTAFGIDIPGVVDGEVGEPDYFTREFWVGPFDFPLINSNRLPDGNLCSVVLTSIDPGAIEVTVVFFPAERASLRDRRFFDDIISDALKITAGQ
jgi:hypothetical protein